MADIIQLLPEYLANQIAAGEVVQRPASAVKELLENAVDAGATQVQLIVKEAGKQLVQVVDNGTGMSATDARMSLERHATSKIRTTDDLFRIRTLGFRGEALASIAAVAQVELRTKQRGQDTGSLLLVEGSQITSQQPVACPDGTSISVKNLFFNVPARRNFLKSNAVEMRHILDEFQHVALANPQISFSLFQNDLEVFNLPAGKLSQRIVALLGNGYKEQLAQVEEVTPFISVKGYIGKPESAKKSRGDQFFFVNNRFIRSAYLNHAVLTAYEGLLPKDTHPFYVLFLELDPKTIDINVHPTKTEIKFEDEKTVYAIVRAAVKQSLGLHNMAPSLDFDGDVNFAPIQPLRLSGNEQNPFAGDFKPDALASAAARAASTPSKNESKSGRADAYERQLPPRPTDQAKRELEEFYKSLQQVKVPDVEREATAIGVPVPSAAAIAAARQAEEAAQQTAPELPSNVTNGLAGSEEPVGQGAAPFVLPAPSAATPELPLREASATAAPGNKVLQLHQQYLMVPVKSGVMLIDQVAARERILFEQYAQALERETSASQTLLFPRTVTFTPQDFAILREVEEPLKALGFRFSDFGKYTIAVEGIPADVPARDEKELLEGLIEQFRTHAGPVKLDRREQMARALARRVATSAAGSRLSDFEMTALVDKLFACSVPNYTPDGRRTLVLLELSELQAFFTR
ncbi:DNA mismatch repair endonuclease MutL [Hymenobacter taeanensis]|uniref:DNA mismatch repair protein MutL n=1 Tax=Hymenobacter taeanensis TaxID=2735321 RepID=A0A6M6BGF9_9BACT|nr:MULTISPECIES: DNA mismatch repair endonuclease MutL [Hymenobacter]QJX47601.1 DNA mismatch repair endonuclease MutL [Hymenobacter taeanensis]UOQ82915.1 DNA mismatch repair endonuclease MutL [Hymenobacter sp. 5414T-23]